MFFMYFFKHRPQLDKEVSLFQQVYYPTIIPNSFPFLASIKVIIHHHMGIIGYLTQRRCRLADDPYNYDNTDKQRLPDLRLCLRITWFNTIYLLEITIIIGWWKNKQNTLIGDVRGMRTKGAKS
jgi:hypothetical protein